MGKTTPSDPELLKEWLGQRREAAFNELVARYAGLVHATARRTCGDDSLAGEVSQLTFITLAKKAKSLTTCASLGGWLHTTALMQAKNLIRKSQRENRKRQLFQTSMETGTSHSQDEIWKEMQPVLDDALASLSEKDREALLLRFYRSLTVREIATTLGIATNAAQKRIDRATGRLRGRLTKRGCQAGGSLAAAMLTGFATDSQAATPLIASLTTQSMAAGSGGSGGIAALFTHLTTTMKTSSSIPALAALFVVGAWLANQRLSIASLERQNGLLHDRLAAGTGIATDTTDRNFPASKGLGQRPIDWYEVARRLDTGEGAGGYLRTTLRLEEGLLSMTREELISALDEVAVCELPDNYRRRLENELSGYLIQKDPEYGLKRYFAKVYVAGSDQVDLQYANALGRWAGKEPERAVAWFDEQVAAGKIGSKSLKPNLYVRIQWEGALTSALLPIDPEAAGRRLAALPEQERINVLSGDTFGLLWRNPEMALPFANLLRQQLPEKNHLSAITWPVSRLGEGGTIEFSEIQAYLKRIEATPVERDRCILAMAGTGTFPRKSGRFKTDNEDLDALKTWVKTEAPELAERAIVNAIAGLTHDINYPDAARLALHCHGTGGGDDVLLPLLKDYKAMQNKELARDLAGRLSDTTLRREYLEKFK